MEQPNSGASINSQRVGFVVYDTFGDVTYPLAIPNVHASAQSLHCRTWPLNENWLITAATCGQKSEHPDKNVEVRTHKISLENPDFDFATNDRIMLIWKNNDQSATSFAAPFTKLLALDTAARLISLQWQNKILLSKGRKTKSTSVELGYHGQYTCKIDKKASWTNALFVVTPQGSELLSAFSDTYFDYNRHSNRIRRSPFFNNLTKRDLQFIKETVNTHRPQDWQSIRTRLFYNDMEKPYFD